MFSLLFISTLLAGIVFPSVFPDEARVETLHRSMQAFATERKLITVITDATIGFAVSAWCNNDGTEYGLISEWDTSRVTDMSSLFYSSACSTFNSDISGWDGKYW